MATLTTAYIGFWEETLCRGYLLRAIGGRHGIVTLALISGAAFVPFHFTQFGAVPQYFNRTGSSAASRTPCPS
jgi:membrane protease YdiL (CAAX protease family)